MKRFILFLALLTSAMTMQAQSTNEKKAMFEEFRTYFNDQTAVAYAQVGNQQVMLVSTEVYGNNENDDLNAISATIFVQDEAGKMICLGSVRSQGTLYPVSIYQGKLVTAGHEFVNVYELRENPTDLYLVHNNDEGTKLEEQFKVFEKSIPVLFQRH